MNAITLALLGTCMLLVAHGIPISKSVKHPKIVAKKLGNAATRSFSSSYANALSSESSYFVRIDGFPDFGYYFQAIEVTVTTSGTYTLATESDIDTIGYLYDITFDPSEPTENLITYDDDSSPSFLQFSIEAVFEAGHTYVLVVTTHQDYETGTFSVTADGPSAAQLTSITPTTSKPIDVVPPQLTVSSSYSNGLTASSGVFYRLDGYEGELYHFEAIELTVTTSGEYVLTSDSELDTMGYLYDTTFDPSVPHANLIADDDDSGDFSMQFKIDANLEAGHTYVLVVTTHGESETGDFSVLTYGPAQLSFTAITPTTSIAIVAPIPEPTVSSTFSSELSSTSPTFIRPEGEAEPDYHYAVFNIVAPTSGTYSFTSASELDTMGYLYETSFDPSKPMLNLIMDDDDSGDDTWQFHISAYLEAEKQYTLVVTTHGTLLTGSFDVIVNGPASVALQ